MKSEFSFLVQSWQKAYKSGLICSKQGRQNFCFMEALLIDQFQIRQDRFIHQLLEISRHIIVAQLADLRGKYCGRSDDAGPLLIRQSPRSEERRVGKEWSTQRSPGK